MQDPRGLVQHLPWEAGEASHVDAVGPVAPSRLEAAEKDDLVAMFPDRHVGRNHAGQQVGELHELVIVRGEYRPGPDAVVDVGGDRPGDRNAIVRRCSTADLVQKHQAPLGSRVQDRRRLGHLDHEGALASSQAVRGADPGEDAVAEPYPRAIGRHEGADLRHQDDQADLAEHGGLAGHVRPGEHHHEPLAVQYHIVRNELLARHHRLDDRMPSAADLEAELLDDFRAAVTASRRRRGEGGQHVQLSDALRGPLDPLDLCRDRLPHLAVEARLQLADPQVRIDDLLFPLLQLRRHEALGAGEGLLALVVLGDPIQVRTGDLQVVSEDLVVADLQGPDARSPPFPLLQRSDPFHGPRPQASQLVQLGRIPGSDDAPIGQGGRRFGRDRPLHEIPEVGEHVQAPAQLPDSPLSAAPQLADVRQLPE